MEGRRGDFGGAQSALFRQVEHELGWGLGTGGVNEFKGDAINHAYCAAPFNFLGRQDQADRALRQAGAKARTNMA